MQPRPMRLRKDATSWQELLGLLDGASDGEVLEEMEGAALGTIDGTRLGTLDGRVDGEATGRSDGRSDGRGDNECATQMVWLKLPSPLLPSSATKERPSLPEISPAMRARRSPSISSSPGRVVTQILGVPGTEQKLRSWMRRIASVVVAVGIPSREAHPPLHVRIRTRAKK